MLQNYSNPTAFYCGFTQQEYTYDEGQDEGIHFIPFRAAPGYATEKTFTFFLSLNGITGTFTFGRMLLQSAQ